MHNQDRLEGLTTFVTVVETGGFSSAAAVLGRSPSHVSKEVSKLEDRLGMRLLNRTTRTISLTDEGRLYFERSKQIVADAEEAEIILAQRQDSPRGRLKVSAPVSLGLGILKQELPGFLRCFPDLELEIELNDRMVDVVAEAFDVVIRVGDLKDSSLVNRQIMKPRALVVAAPAYLKRHGRPSHPRDLIDHDCISYSMMQKPDHWEFQEASGKTIDVKVNVRALCNSAELEAAFAAGGIGITRLPAFACMDELESGALVPILEDFEHAPLGVYAVYPNRKHLSAKVRAFVDFLVENFADQDESKALN